MGGKRKENENDGNGIISSDGGRQFPLIPIRRRINKYHENRKNSWYSLKFLLYYISPPKWDPLVDSQSDEFHMEK